MELVVNTTLEIHSFMKPIFACKVFLPLFTVLPMLSSGEPGDRAPKATASSEMGTKSPSYPNASAHDPYFADEELWPHLTSKEAFKRQVWPKTRLLIWAHRSEADANGKKPEDAANWLEAGKPAGAPPDENTDVLFPTSIDGKPYTVEGARNFTCRHLTIQESALIKSHGMDVHGNFWLKNGGRIRVMGPLNMLGAGDAFLRVEGKGDSTDRESALHRPLLISQYLTLNRRGSIELIGSFASGDEFKVFGGTHAVIHPHANVGWGRNATLNVFKGAVVTLMDGSRFSKWVNQFGRMGDAKVAGTVQGGSPERPLSTADALFAMGFNNWTGAVFPVPEDEEKAEKANATKNKRFYGLVLEPGAKLLSHTTDPAQARLVIGWHGIELSQYIHDHNSGEHLDPGFKVPFESIPPQITLFFDLGVTVDTITIDDVHSGGLLMKNPDDFKKWKNVRYGKNIGAPPEKLVAPAPEKSKGASTR